MPHVILVFDEIDIADIVMHRPKIEGVRQELTKHLGEHDDPQEWISLSMTARSRC